MGTAVLWSDYDSVTNESAVPFQSPYLKSSWWKSGDVVAEKIEEHQLLCAREGLGMDGLDGISFQVDAFNLWN